MKRIMLVIAASIDRKALPVGVNVCREFLMLLVSLGLATKSRHATKFPRFLPGVEAMNSKSFPDRTLKTNLHIFH